MSCKGPLRPSEESGPKGTPGLSARSAPEVPWAGKFLQSFRPPVSRVPCLSFHLASLQVLLEHPLCQARPTAWHGTCKPGAQQDTLRAGRAGGPEVPSEPGICDGLGGGLIREGAPWPVDPDGSGALRRRPGSPGIHRLGWGAGEAVFSAS